MNNEKLEARRESKRLQKELERLEAEKNQKPVKSITINIEWKRSATWGSNPNCEARIEFKDGHYETSPIFKASGCGYDKESTVIAEVFNTYLKYKLFKELVAVTTYINSKESKVPYGINLPSKNYKFPHYSGGIGTNCYYNICKAISGTFEHVSSGKSFDVFRYTDND